MADTPNTTSEPVVVPNTGTPIQGEAPEASQQPNAVESKAKDMGWRPLEDFDGNPDEFIDAGEFVRRKPLFDKIETTTKQLKNVSKSLDYLKEHYQKVKETEYNRAIADLNAQRKTAKKEGNNSLEASRGSEFAQLYSFDIRKYKTVLNVTLDTKANSFTFSYEIKMGGAIPTSDDQQKLDQEIQEMTAY